MKSTGAAGLLGMAGENEEEKPQKRTESNKPPRKFADLVLHNGKILTMDNDDPDDITIAKALAIQNSYILSVGDRDDAERFVGPETERINLDGKTVIPGLIDTHGHLHQYSVRHHGEEFFPDLVKFEVPVEEGEPFTELVERALQAIEEQAAQTESGKWVRVTTERETVTFEDDEVRPRTPLWTVDPPLFTREDVDEVAPDNSVEMEIGSGRAIYNTPALGLARELYGPLTSLIEPETGIAQSRGAMRSFQSDLMLAQDKEAQAGLQIREMEEYAKDNGITTWCSSVGQTFGINILLDLGRAGEMPIRFALSHSAGDIIFDQPAAFYTRFGTLRGYGNDFVWINGTSVTAIDSSYPLARISLDAPPEIKDREFTRLTSGAIQERTLRRNIKMGQRTVSNHTVGDETLDIALDIIEEESLDAGMSYEEIRARRHAFDHGDLWPREDQVPRLQKLGIIPSFYMKTIQGDQPDAEDMIDDYGEEVLDQLLPVKRCVDAGLKPVMEWDDHLHPHGPFIQLESVVTRGSGAGPNPPKKVYNPDQAVDRMTALLMATRWAARYVLKENVLGSIEEGKLADIVVLDKDYLNVPECRISELDIEMTMVDGEIVSSSL